jgi:WD40 repeat protein
MRDSTLRRSLRTVVFLPIAFCLIAMPTIAALAADGIPIVRPAMKVSTLDVKALREASSLGDDRFRHADSLIHIAVLPDGKRLVASAQDGTARMWDCETGKEIQRFYNGKGGYVWCCAVLGGGKEVLTCGTDQRITRWDVKSGESLHHYEQGSSTIRLAVAPDGQSFAAVGDENRTILWDVMEGRKLRTLRGHTDSVYGAAIDADSRFLVTCGDDKTIRIWNFAEGDSRHKLTAHAGAVHTAAFAPDGPRFTTCSDDHSVRMWDAESGEEIWNVTLPSTVYVVAWSPDGKRLAATCEDKHIYLLNAEDGKQTLTIPTPHGYHWPVAFAPDGNTLYSGGSGMVWRWDAATGKQLFPNPDDKPLVGAVAAMAVAPDGELVYLCGSDAAVHVWSVKENKRIAAWPMDKAIKSLDVSPNGAKVLAGDDANVHVLDAATGKTLTTIKCGENYGAAAFVESARRVVTVSQQETARLWDATSGASIETLSGHLRSIAFFGVSADGDRIVTGSSDGTARVWGAHSGKELSRVGMPSDNEDRTMRLPTFLADNRSLAVIEDDKQLRVWLAPNITSTSDASADDVRRWINDLSSEKYRVRELATRKLVGVASAMREHIENVSVDDPEVTWRLRQIMLGVERGSTPSAPLGTPLAFEETPQSLAIHPDGIHFAVTLRTDAQATIVLGQFTLEGPQTLRTITTGHSPSMLSFSADGRRLFAANRDGTVSVFE